MSGTTTSFEAAKTGDEINKAEMIKSFFIGNLAKL
jgi:hypothetical protein